MKALVVFCCLLYTANIFAQDIDYAREVLDTLCSEHFDGRGFFDDGERRAAEFIKEEFKSFGLTAFGNSYFQKFNLSVNSIVGETLLEVGNNKLAAGIDYLIDPSSPRFSGKSDLYFLKKSEMIDTDKFKIALRANRNKFIVFSQALIKEEGREVKGQVYEMIQFLKYGKDLPIQGVLELVEEKLTFTASQTVAERPHVITLTNRIPSKAKELRLEMDNVYEKKYESQNVAGFIEGEIKDSFICIIGHYDHLGRMGDGVYFPGANDNASGIAMLLNLAKEFSVRKPKYSIAFIAFGAEEIGLVGSKYYTENPLFPLENIKFLINLDILGTGDDGIQVVNGKEYRKDFDRLVQLNEDNDLLKQVKIRGEACNSDHCFFHEKGVPSFFIYTLGGVAHYHDVYDRSETLPLTEYEDLFQLLMKFIVN